MSGNAYVVQEARQAIRARSDSFERFFAAADAAGLVGDYYVSEPRMSAPDTPLLRGRKEIEGLFAEVMKTFSQCRLEQTEVMADQELAYELGRAFLEPRDPAGEAAECRYMIAWRKGSDGWRVETDFFAFGSLL